MTFESPVLWLIPDFKPRLIPDFKTNLFFIFLDVDPEDNNWKLRREVAFGMGYFLLIQQKYLPPVSERVISKEL